MPVAVMSLAGQTFNLMTLGGLAAAGLGLGLLIFLFVPRVSVGAASRFQSTASRGRTLTGFSGSVRLGQIGQILENIDRVMRVSRQLHSGQVFVNNYGAGGGIELPFGGVKHSGHGREKGFEALLGFTVLKTIAIKHG